jgi:hypothetical protein
MGKLKSGIVAGLTSLLATSPVWAAGKTFYIDEVTSYPGGGCASNISLNVVTESLQTAMEGLGWTGHRYVNPDAWPQDFKESCSTNYAPDGIDYLEADAASVAVFAGHAGVNTLPFGVPYSGQCSANFSTNMRLGALDGQQASYGIWLGCDVLDPSQLPYSVNYQWLNQQFGWGNTIGIDDNEPVSFFDLTGTWIYLTHSLTPPYFYVYDPIPNVDSWFEVMTGDDREAVVVSYGSSSSACWARHNSAEMQDVATLNPRTGWNTCNSGVPGFYYCYEVYD